MDPLSVEACRPRYESHLGKLDLNTADFSFARPLYDNDTVTIQ